ncbi:MAG: hypothetical protein E6G43_12300 [Actinobacteria bacterium]|nr:MAG: hypothetical protein E6G43_12300 [Actinomycetota bacterium]
MGYDTVLYEVDGHVATITMNRPEVANAQNSALLDDLDAAFDAADADDDVRVVILAGAGKHFSSGHDLKSLVGGEPDAWRAMRETAEGKLRHEQVMYFDRCVKIRDFRKPTIAAVQGSCVAAGLMLACMCDLIVAADDAVFQNPVLRMTGAAVELLVEPCRAGEPRRSRRRADGAHARARRSGGARPATDGADREGLAEPDGRSDGPAPVVEVPLHGPPMDEQHRDGAERARAAQAEGLDEGGLRRARGRSAAAVSSRPLEGVRVIDVGTRISAPFCAGLLGELGAEVIKVEQPGEGDFMRTIGPFVDGYSLFWAVEGRGRKGVTCDLRTSEGQDLFRRLAATADVVCENFRPGTMEAWHVGPGDLDPRLVMVRISVFGQDGPYSARPGLAHAAVAALYERDVKGTGTGAVVDAPLYGAVLRILEWTIAGYDRLGIVRNREGNRLANSAPLDNYPTADGKYVCIVAGSDANFRRLCDAMEQPDLFEDPRFRDLAHRAEHGDEINGIVADWTSSRTAAEVEAACVAHDVPVGTAYSAADIVTDAHMAARGDLVTVDDSVVGPMKQQAPFPRLDGRPPAPPTSAPRLGEHNEEIWCGLVGLSPDELAALRDKGVV